jgi:uncharacterized membrane protein YbaN (DUF454 family)
MRFWKPILIVLGTLSLSLGIFGIIVPGLPTTPFLLLTAGLYLRSSETLYNWVISNRLVGPYIVNYNKNKGITRKVKIKAISLMVAMISLSTIFFIDTLTLRLIVVSLGIIGAIVVMFVVPTVK